MTNDELAQMVDTSDEWILERTGIRERRVAAPDEAMSDLALPASLGRARAGRRQAVRPRADRRRDRDAGHALPVDRRDPRRSARREGRGRLRPVRGLHRFRLCGRRRRTRWSRAASPTTRSSSAGTSCRAIVDWTDRSTCVLFGDGAGAVVLERVDRGRFPRLRARRGRIGRAAAVHTGRRLASARVGRVGGRAPALREDERARGLQVRDPCARRLGREGAARMRRLRRRRGRLRAAPGERAHHRARDARNWASRRSGRWSTSTATATLHLDRSRWRSAMPRPTGDWLQVKWS